MQRIRGERGATTVEYAVMAALVALVLIGSLNLLGDAMQVAFDNHVERIED